MNRPSTRKSEFAPCAGHDTLTAADRSACLRQIPVGASAQLTFLIDRRATSWAAFYPKAGPRRIRRLAIKDVANTLYCRPHVVRRHAKGSLLPPGRSLRERLNTQMTHAFCPVHLAQVDAEHAADIARAARRKAAQSLEGREQARLRQATLQARLDRLPGE